MPKTNSGSKGLRQEAEALIKQAIRQPGIRELMAVYEEWKAVDEVQRMKNRIQSSPRRIAVSNSSGPAIRSNVY